MGLDTAEFEKAKRVVDKRRGELLGPAITKQEAGRLGGRGNKAYPSVEVLSGEKIPDASQRRYRLIAKWWKPVIYPYLCDYESHPVSPLELRHTPHLAIVTRLSRGEDLLRPPLLIWFF